MASKQLAVLATLLGIATPGHAFDTRNEAQTVMFYYAIPLDAHSKKDRAPWLGMQINGKRDYQSYSMDSKLLTFGGSERSDHRRGRRRRSCGCRLARQELAGAGPAKAGIHAAAAGSGTLPDRLREVAMP
jgi:hypothetical protein